MAIQVKTVKNAKRKHDRRIGCEWYVGSNGGRFRFHVWLHTKTRVICGPNIVRSRLTSEARYEKNLCVHADGRMSWNHAGRLHRGACRRLLSPLLTVAGSLRVQLLNRTRLTKYVVQPVALSMRGAAAHWQCLDMIEALGAIGAKAELHTVRGCTVATSRGRDRRV